MTIAHISREKTEYHMWSNIHSNKKEKGAIIHLIQKIYVQFKQWRKIIHLNQILQSQRTNTEIDKVKTIEYDVKSHQFKKENIIMYKDTTKKIET